LIGFLELVQKIENILELNKQVVLPYMLQQVGFSFSYKKVFINVLRFREREGGPFSFRFTLDLFHFVNFNHEHDVVFLVWYLLLSG